MADITLKTRLRNLLSSAKSAGKEVDLTIWFGGHKVQFRLKEVNIDFIQGHSLKLLSDATIECTGDVTIMLDKITMTSAL